MPRNETLGFVQRYGIRPTLETMPMSKENKAWYRVVLVSEGNP